MNSTYNDLVKTNCNKDSNDERVVTDLIQNKSKTYTVDGSLSKYETVFRNGGRPNNFKQMYKDCET
jgi:hypothetical protein